MTSTARAFALAVLLAMFAAGCGADDDSGRFDDAVAQVRAAVDAGDREAATNGLDVVAFQALAAHDEGAIDGEELAEVAELIESSRLLVADIVPAPTTTARPTTTTTTTTEARDEADKPDRGNDKKKDDDDDKDDDD